METKEDKAIAYARAHNCDFLEGLRELLAIPSVAADPARAADVRRAAEWIAGRLRALGLEEVGVLDTRGHPIVRGTRRGAPGAPTVLLYGHYDVQPAEPLELWKEGPFAGKVEGENLIGRGASDMKGQLVAALAAVESISATGSLPVNLVCLFEGEEEIGSPSLGDFLRENRELFACNFVLNVDGGFLAPECPTIGYGLRGLAYFELEVLGPKSDLHSGMYGGAVHNPAIVLADLVSAMHDKSGRIALPGFYDEVRALSRDERAEFARLPRGDADCLAETGVPVLWGEEGYTSNERTGARPSLDINGIWSGYTGEGAKTVIPARAKAKISCRLVPDQDPEKIEARLRAFLEAKVPETVSWELRKLAGCRASISSRNSPWIAALDRALERTWDSKTVFRREGGSVPAVALMQDILGADSALTGFGLPDDNVHAPNEKLHLPTWRKGIEALIRFFLDLEGKSGS